MLFVDDVVVVKSNSLSVDNDVNGVVNGVIGFVKPGGGKVVMIRWNDVSNKLVDNVMDGDIVWKISSEMSWFD